MHTPPIRSHTIHITRTPNTSPSLNRPSPSTTRLPSVTSATSSFSSFNHSLRAPSPQKSPRQPGKQEVVSRQDAGSKRSVSWLDDRRFGKDSRGSSTFSSSKKEVKPAEVWARYIQTVRPSFKLYEPCRRRFAKGGGGGKNSKGVLLEPEDDSRYALKLSFPCPSDAGCCFCVYSRQLGPVRVYFSNYRRSKLQPVGRGTKSAPGNNVGKNGKGSKETNGDEPKMLVPKERWLNCSAPSGEIIVPDPPPDVEERSLRLHCKSQPAVGELGGVRGRNPWLRDSRRVVGARRTTSQTKEWLGNSAPWENFNHASCPVVKDSLRNPGHIRSVTFQNCDDDRDRKAAVHWAGLGTSPKTPKNSPRSHNTSSVCVSGRSVGNRDRKIGNSSVYDQVKGPLPFPVREHSVPLRLLPKRQGHQ